MSSPSGWDTVHLLSEPTRRRIYAAVREAESPLTREAVADAAGVGRRLAAFHLDALAAAGLLSVDYARPPGRTGPGAGRPAKRYAAVDIDVDVSLPARRYDLAARILARAITAADGADARPYARQVARAEGESVGRLRRRGGRMSTARTLEAAADTLADLGYEPKSDGEGCIRLRNCPFHAVVDVAGELVCGVNEDFVAGVLTGLDGHASVTAALDGVQPDCCVTVARR